MIVTLKGLLSNNSKQCGVTPTLKLGSNVGLEIFCADGIVGNRPNATLLSPDTSRTSLAKAIESKPTFGGSPCIKVLDEFKTSSAMHVLGDSIRVRPYPSVPASCYSRTPDRSLKHRVGEQGIDPCMVDELKYSSVVSEPMEAASSLDSASPLAQTMRNERIGRLSIIGVDRTAEHSVHALGSQIFSVQHVQ